MAEEMYNIDNDVTRESGDIEEPLESLLRHEDTDLDDIPPALLRYFEASKSRAALWEGLILEELQGSSASHSIDNAVTPPLALTEDLKDLNQQATEEAERETSGSSAYTSFLYADGETEKLFTHSFSAHSTSEDTAEVDECLGLEKTSDNRAGDPQSSATEGTIMESCQDEGDTEKSRKKQEKMRQIQNQFQEELMKLMESEKLHQKELQMMERRAQEKLELEFQLQQELIRSLQQRVDEEKKMNEEAHRRIKEESERKRKEKEQRRKEDELRMKGMEEETGRSKQEEDKRKTEQNSFMERLKRRREEEEKRKKMEEEETRREEEEKRKREAVKNGTREDRRTEEEINKREIRRGSKENEVTKELNRKCVEGERGTMMEGERMRQNEETGVKERKLKDNEYSGEKGERREEEQMVTVGHGVRKKDEERNKEETRTSNMMVEQMKKGEEVKQNKLKEEEKTKEKEEQVRHKVEEEKEEVKGFRKEREWNKLHKEDVMKQQEGEKKNEEKDELRRRKRNLEANKEDVRKGKDENTEVNEKQPKDKSEMLGRCEEKKEKYSMKTAISTVSSTSQVQNHAAVTSSAPGESDSVSTTSSETVQEQDPHNGTQCLPEHTEQKRLSWMKSCVSWTKLSLQHKSKRKGSAESRGGASKCTRLPPLCPRALLLSTGCQSLQQVTSVTLQDLPGCSLSTLSQCRHLQSLTLRRCGLNSLEGISKLPQLSYIDAQENDISFVDFENMTGLQVLRLGRNKLTSIHGFGGAKNLDVLDLSHNSITRIVGLESMRKLQWLSLSHNRLVSAKGLREVSTLLHLDCSHNYLAAVEGLENNVLLHTLDLQSNNLYEPPNLTNHVLLRELHLDDNSISSLHSLAICWLPLMHCLSAAQNRITVLLSMSDFISLANLDLRYNCISELHNVCESLAGCRCLQEIHLTGNAFQQESGWRSALQKAVTSLGSIDGEKTDSPLSAPAVRQVSLASGSFRTFCQAQLKQTSDLQQQHSRELSQASTSLEAAKLSCRHCVDTLTLAVEQRLAHEFGITTISAGQTVVEKPQEDMMDSANADAPAESSDVESLKEEPPVIQSGNDMSYSCRTVQEKSPTETGLHFLMAPVSAHREQDSINTAAAVIQQRWKTHGQKCGNISGLLTAEHEGGVGGGGGGGGGGRPESGCSNVEGEAAKQANAATAIQALWRGFALRRRLASALAAVTWADSSEDETFEEVDVDEFVFDEAAAEQPWLVPEDSSSCHHHASEHSNIFKSYLQFESHETSRDSPPTIQSTSLWSPKQAWVDGEHLETNGQRIPSEISGRQRTLPSVFSGACERSEKIQEEWGFKNNKTAMQMLKRAHKMRSKKLLQKKYWDPPVCQQGPSETRNRPPARRRSYTIGRSSELGMQPTEQMEKVKQERSHHIQSDKDADSDHFLPEISSDILNGGRVQLVADPSYHERLHHSSGLWASSSLAAAQPSKERRNSAGRATSKQPPSPKPDDCAPVKRGCISFRDPVHQSSGWGGGKKREKTTSKARSPLQL